MCGACEAKGVLWRTSPTLWTTGNLANTYRQLGQLNKAAELQGIALEKQKIFLGEGYPDTLYTMGNLANTYRELGQLREAENLGGLALQKQKEILGEEHPDTLLTMGNLVLTYNNLGQLTEAEELDCVLPLLLLRSSRTHFQPILLLVFTTCSVSATFIPDRISAQNRCHRFPGCRRKRIKFATVNRPAASCVVHVPDAHITPRFPRNLSVPPCLPSLLYHLLVST
jgi:hypothetical protein